MIIRVMAYRVGKPPAIETIDDELEALQQFVGGYVEQAFIPESELAVICNEDGKLLKLPPNRDLGFDVIHGDFLITRPGGEEYVDLTDADVAWLKEWIQ